MLRPVLSAAFLLVCSSMASAQVIYEPVRYQHGPAPVMYYGGMDPHMLDYMEQVRCRNGYPSMMSFDGYSGLHRTLGQIGEKTYVFTDCMPRLNAAVYGYTATDAHNEAYANFPRYFRKGDLLDTAIEMPDGSRVVSAYARPVMGAMVMPAPRMESEMRPRAIIILPKGKRKAPVAPAEKPDKQVVMAD